MKESVIRVSGKTTSKGLAGSIAISVLKPECDTILHCIGASSVNQAMKACAIARGILGAQGYNLIIIPGFVDLDVNGKEVSGLKFKLKIS